MEKRSGNRKNRGLLVTETPVFGLVRVNMRPFDWPELVLGKKLWTTYPTDPQGLEIKRSENRTWINMRKLFAKMKVSRKPGPADRFDLVPADDKAPVKPALMINLQQSRDTRHIETSSRKRKSNSK